jgi:hypothetical protein
MPTTTVSRPTLGDILAWLLRWALDHLTALLHHVEQGKHLRLRDSSPATDAQIAAAVRIAAIVPQPQALLFEQTEVIPLARTGDRDFGLLLTGDLVTATVPFTLDDYVDAWAKAPAYFADATDIALRAGVS